MNVTLRSDELRAVLLSAPSQDLVRACAALLPDGVSRTAEDLAMDLRGRGWTVDTAHLEYVLSGADRIFLRTGDSFALLPRGSEPPASQEISRDDVHARLTRKLQASWWRIMAVQSAYPPALDPPTTAFARALEQDRRTRVIRVAKVHDGQHIWMLAWIDQVTVPRRESLPAWSCWRVDQLDGWEPGRNPIQPRYEGAEPSELVVVHAAADAPSMADVILRALDSTKARPQDVWIEPVPADGAEVDARTRTLAESRQPWRPGRGRRVAAPACKWCGRTLVSVEEVSRGADAACWAVHEPFGSAALRFTRPEWVGALELSAWAEVVADPPRGGAPGLSRGRVVNQPA